jgi:hypothetical protein
MKHPRAEVGSNSSADDIEEMVADALRQMRLNNMPIADERYVGWVVERTLQYILDQEDRPEDAKRQARFHARLIEAALPEIRNATNRPLIVSVIVAALGLSMMTGFSREDLGRIYKEARSALGKKGGKARRKEPPWTTHAKELALKSFAENPTRANELISVEISFGWRLSELKAPSLKTLTRFVAKLRTSGDLPPRTSS